MTVQQSRLTDAQQELVSTLDDVAEHVAWEFDPEEYEGFSTCGFASIKNIDGRGSFVQRVKSLAESDHPAVTERERRSDYVISVGGASLRLSPERDSGYRLSLTNVSDFRSGPEYQRLDVRRRLHELVLGRLQYNGYCDRGRVHGRMD